LKFAAILARMIINHKKFQDVKISASHSAYEIVKSLLKGTRGFERDKEHLYAIGLSRSNTIRYIDLVSIGSISSTIAAPREIFRMAVHKAVGGGIIIAHNHPSGNLIPSNEDKMLTQKIKEAGKILEIPLIDHLIFTSKGYYSFMDDGLL
jgi:DNA repair protein RadC